MSSVLNEALNGENTKFKALVDHMNNVMAAAYGKDKFDMEGTQRNALAKILATSKLTASRPDRRFPNCNQLNNCWYVAWDSLYLMKSDISLFIVFPVGLLSTSTNFVLTSVVRTT